MQGVTIKVNKTNESDKPVLLTDYICEKNYYSLKYIDSIEMNEFYLHQNPSNNSLERFSKCRFIAIETDFNNVFKFNISYVELTKPLVSLTVGLTTEKLAYHQINKNEYKTVVSHNMKIYGLGLNGNKVDFYVEPGETIELDFTIYYRS